MHGTRTNVDVSRLQFGPWRSLTLSHTTPEREHSRSARGCGAVCGSSLGHYSIQAPLAGRHGRAVRQRQAPQLEPRSQHSVTLRAPAKPPQPCVSTTAVS